MATPPAAPSEISPEMIGAAPDLPVRSAVDAIGQTSIAVKEEDNKEESAYVHKNNDVEEKKLMRKSLRKDRRKRNRAIMNEFMKAEEMQELEMIKIEMKRDLKEEMEKNDNQRKVEEKTWLRELREMFQYVQSATVEVEYMREMEKKEEELMSEMVKKEEKLMREIEKEDMEYTRAMEKEEEYMREKKRKRLRLRAFMKMPESEKINYIELKHSDIDKGIAEVKKAMKAWHGAHKKAMAKEESNKKASLARRPRRRILNIQELEKDD